MDNRFMRMKVSRLMETYTYTKDFFHTMLLPVNRMDLTIGEYFNELDSVMLENMGLEKTELMEQFASFMQHMEQIHRGIDLDVSSITLLGGYDKSGQPEHVALRMRAGEILCIVGPTGSGKSRLLADIEWMAQRDTPTGRQILINDALPDPKWRFSLEHKLVAQLSQNMNFVMDVSVEDFIRLHAESRMIGEPQTKIELILRQANLLAGEEIFPQMPVTSLSGGQSRALMIADTAFLSTSPIVLIDEIENAGIDRKKALDLLVKREKIVLMATHDPVLALMGDRRMVIKNGGISKIIETSPEEKAHLQELQKLDAALLHYRNLLRQGERIV